jgi:hypothetical protein
VKKTVLCPIGMEVHKNNLTIVNSIKQGMNCKMITQYSKETCKCCYGTGVQTTKDNIRILCPVCNGTGWIWKSNFDDLPPGIYCCSNQNYYTTVSFKVF